MGIVVKESAHLTGTVTDWARLVLAYPSRRTRWLMPWSIYLSGASERERLQMQREMLQSGRFRIHENDEAFPSTLLPSHCCPRP
jgi:hypothetical protein